VGDVLRRALRLTLTVGVLVGIAVAVAKVLGKRSLGTEPAPEPSAPWPRLEPDPGLHEPPATTSLLPDPDAPHTSNGAPRPAPAARATKATKATKRATTATATAADTAWVEPTGDVCPTSHPVKGKLGSKIFHLPGMLNYERTRPDRCSRDGDAAEADGLRPAKR
jgi:hypothetical protein